MIGSVTTVFDEATDFFQASNILLLELTSKKTQAAGALTTLSIQTFCSDLSQMLFFGDVMPETDRKPPKK